MSVEHERLKEILAEAAGKATPEARAAFLAAACLGDAALRQQVEALLSAHARAGDFLEKTVEVPPADFVIERTGAMIGRYRLLEKIGEGGFGTVFMAEQTEPVQRKVALKIIKAGMDTREVIARFEAERQALARMDHPNIARVLDAGTTETSRPYFVMELVRGIPITDYCDQKQLSTVERLRLFMKVCAAVQHAHQKAIIHRDLKPTNILVTVIDGEPVPKIIDFGVAKALGQKLTEKTLFTSFQQMIGTPAYMSPEQAELSGVDVDTRSDIYSLGVLLYELLTGVTPFDADTLRKAALDEIRRLIRETEPPRPSTRLMELAKNQKSEVTSPKWKEVHGDLDWIVMKALEKDRVRRYGAVNNLAEDIDRHLNHQPVSAVAPGVLYRMGRFVRRHRFGFATASVLVALLVAGVAVSTWQAARATRAEKAARTVAAFLEDTLKSVTPEQARGKDITLLRQMLDQAAARVDKELKNQPLIEAWLRNTLGEVYFALGEYPKAEAMFRRSLEVRERLLGKEHPDTLGSLNNLALLLDRKGDHAEAEPLFRRALEARERTLGKEHPDTLGSLNNLANLLSMKSDYAGAEPLYRRALEARERTLGREHRDTLRSVNNLAGLLFMEGDYAGAESLCRRALDARERTLGKEHLDTLDSVGCLALLLKAKGDFAEAEPFYRRALEGQERTLGKEHPDTLLGANNLGLLLEAKGDYAGAEALYRRALDGRRKLLGNEHPEVACDLDRLGGALIYQSGKGEEAERVLRESLAMHEKLGGPDHPHVPGVISSLAYCLRSEGKLAEAEGLYAEALTNAGTGGGQTLNDIAWILATSVTPKLRDGSNAVLLAEKAAALTSRKNPAYLDTLAAAWAEAGQFSNAVSVQEEAMALVQSDEEKSDYASRLRLYLSGIPYHDPASLAERTLVLLAEGSFAEAEPPARECLAIREKQTPDDWRTFNGRSLLGGSLLGQKKYAEAEPLLLSGYEGMKQREDKIPTLGKPHLKKALQRLVQLYEATGRTNQAAEWKQKLAEFENTGAAQPPP